MLNQNQLGVILLMAVCAFVGAALLNNHVAVRAALSDWWRKQRDHAAQRAAAPKTKAAPLLIINMPGQAVAQTADYDESEEEEQEHSQSGGNQHSQATEGDIPAPFLKAAEEEQSRSEGQNRYQDLTYADLFQLVTQARWTRTELIILLSTIRYIDAAGAEQQIKKGAIPPCVGMRAEDAGVIIDTARDERILVRTHPERQQYRFLRPNESPAAE